MRVGSLFAGIGGFDLGLERAGFEIAWQVEIDPYCQRVLAKHWPNAKRYGDIRVIDWETVPRVDLLCGGFPCQDLSFAGKRAGIDGERSGLWSEYVRAIRALRPRYILVENVPGLLTNQYMGRVLGDLAESGYDAEWDCLPASAFGAPHRRDRVWILAYASCTGRRSRGQSSSTRQEIAHRSIETADAERMRKLQPQGSQRHEWRRPSDCSWWELEPDVGRVAHGVPNGTHRIKCLGNSIVPQVAEWLGRQIMKNDPHERSAG